MSEELINYYKADERETLFLLFEQFRIQDLFETERFSHFAEDDARMIISEALSFAMNEIGPLNGYGDRVGCTHDPKTSAVHVPPLHKDLYAKFREAGWPLLNVSEDFGGQAAPYSITLAVKEFFNGASSAWAILPDLSYGASHLIESFGSDDLKATYCEKMYSGQWGGTMCLTEPGAGSEVGRATTKATPNGDGTYSIVGNKCFISSGDHDVTENIVHLLLARVEGAPAGTKGISLFVVPKFRPNPDGSPGEFNDVICRAIEHKMGINASPTCALEFGSEGKCIGWLLGGDEHKGMSQMFQMMNEARISVGLQGLSTASTAYLNALEYAQGRVQGKRFEDMAKGRRDNPSVPIIEHEDVKRMLLEMKSKVEGCRALAFKLAVHADRAAAAPEGSEEAARHEGYIELLTPIVKAYLTDQGFRVCELAIQTHGGYGYIADYPVEQYCRDEKIMSIYEGTNFIQALDLVGRKLNMSGGAYVRQLGADIEAFVKQNASHGALGTEAKRLGEAAQTLNGTIMKFMEFFQSGRNRQIPLIATRFLEMLAEVVVAFLLLEAAVIAHEKLQETPESDPDYDFYTGKVHAARFFIRNILPGVKMKADIIADADTSAIDIKPTQFATRAGELVG